MVSVRFLGPAAAQIPQVIMLEAANLEDVALAFKDDAIAQKWLKISAIAINDKLISSSDISLNEGDKISVLPPVCGG